MVRAKKLPEQIWAMEKSATLWFDSLNRYVEAETEVSSIRLT